MASALREGGFLFIQACNEISHLRKPSKAEAVCFCFSAALFSCRCTMTGRRQAFTTRPSLMSMVENDVK